MRLSTTASRVKFPCSISTNHSGRGSRSKTRRTRVVSAGHMVRVVSGALECRNPVSNYPPESHHPATGRFRNFWENRNQNIHHQNNVYSTTSTRGYVVRLLDSGAVPRRSRAARGACVVVSDAIGAVYVPSVCVVGPRMCSPSRSVSCHVDATFSAARVGADVKDGERCVGCSRMWCWLFGCVHRLHCVRGAIRATAVRVAGPVSNLNQRDVVEESGACRRKCKGWRCV